MSRQYWLNDKIKEMQAKCRKDGEFSPKHVQAALNLSYSEAMEVVAEALNRGVIVRQGKYVWKYAFKQEAAV